MTIELFCLIFCSPFFFLKIFNQGQFSVDFAGLPHICLAE